MIWPSTDEALSRRRDGAIALGAAFRAVVGRDPDPAERAELLARSKAGLTFENLVAELRSTPGALDLAASNISQAVRDLLERDLRIEAEEHPERSAARVMFIHIMKTGGTSLSELLRGWAGPSRSRTALFLDDLVVMPRPQLARLNAICGHLPFESVGLVPGRFSTVTLLRDPVARTISHYRELRRAGERADLTLDEFTSSEVYDVPSGNYMARALAHSVNMADAWIGYSPRERYLEAGGRPEQPYPLQSLFDSTPMFTDDEQLLEAASRNLSRIDLVGVTEHLDQLAARVASCFGAPSVEAPRLNVSSGHDPGELSAPLRKRIEMRTAVDRELYEQALRMSA